MGDEEGDWDFADIYKKAISFMLLSLQLFAKVCMY